VLFKDKAQVVHVPEIRGAPAHRPLGVLSALDQLYGNIEEEGEDPGSDEVNGPQITVTGLGDSEVGHEHSVVLDSQASIDQQLRTTTGTTQRSKPSKFLRFFNRKNLPYFIQRLFF